MRKTIKIIEDDIKGEKATCKVFKDINVELYNCSVVIFKGEEAEKYKRISNNENLTAGTINRLEEHQDIVIVFQNNNPAKSTIVHELTHATQMIMHCIGYDHCKESFDEPFAYLLGFLVAEYYKK